MTKFTALFLILTTQAFANFLPENDLIIKSTNKSNDLGLVNKYQPLINAIKDLYAKEIQDRGANLIVEFEMENNKVNAYARRTGQFNSNWHVVMTGGLLRHKRNNPLVLAAILCHEIGHHLGGSPYKFGNQWASAEGQSDYFATNQCAKKLFAHRDAPEIYLGKTPSIIKNECSKNFTKLNNIQTCIKSSLISIAASNFLRTISANRRGRRTKKTDINKRDKSVVNDTNTSYPSPQCRLDTLFEGSLCNEDDQNCLDSNEWYKGARPQCWFLN